MAQRRTKTEPGGLPDGLIVGIIGFLLGVTVLVWTATGIAALLAHGAWPHDVHFTRTPPAMRALIGEPHDVAAAWPEASPGELPGAGLFWGIFIGQLMVLAVLAVWVISAVARLRDPRRRNPSRSQRPGGPRPPAGPAQAPVPQPRRPRPARGTRGTRAAWTKEAGGDDGDDRFAGSGGDGGDGGAEEATPATAQSARPAHAGDTTSAQPGGSAPAGTSPRSTAHTPRDDSLDAWFRTVPHAAPLAGDDPPPAFSRADPPPTGFPPVPGTAPQSAPAAPGPHLAPHLTGGEVTRTYALFADPRSDKAKHITQPAILAAAGPAVVTTADPDTYHQTAGNRSKLGPVHVYDPAHLLDVPGRLRWAPHGGCEQPQTAGIRAAALLAPLRTARADETIVHDTAVTLLRCWLHAAAVDGRPFQHVQRWAARWGSAGRPNGGGGPTAGEAVRILRTDRAAASGWSGELESVLHAHPERRDAAQALIRRILEPLNSVHIRDACNPAKAGGLDLESFTAERGTLYVVGDRIEDPRSRPGAMPLLTALLSSVVEHGRHMAAGSSAGRLDPPLTFVLDDVAALAPVPALPALLATGHAAGLPTLAVLRSPEQALARWQSPLWQDADIRLALGDETADTLPPSVPDAVRIR